MSDLNHTIIRWADERIDRMLATPRMWGSVEAIELQVVLLLELRALVRRPALELAKPRRVLDAYLAFLRERFPKKAPAPLFRLLEDLEGGAAFPAELGPILREFREALDKTTLVENPFEHSEVAIKLTFDEGGAPTTSAFTGYYEEFRRAARAAARASGSRGRATKEIELATDFTLEDASISPANGRPAEVLLRLGPGNGKKDAAAEASVRDALSSILTLAEWASSNSAVDQFGIDDVDRRTNTALQAMRLLPRRGIRTVEIGGKLVVRSKPVELRADQEKRFLEVVSAAATPVPFDMTDEIRAIDLDRGFIVLGRHPRILCYVQPYLLEQLTEAGVRARVVGQQYHPMAARPFVLAQNVELELDATPSED